MSWYSRKFVLIIYLFWNSWYDKNGLSSETISL